jgi:protein-tyrosine phosphatase
MTPPALIGRLARLFGGGSEDRQRAHTLLASLPPDAHILILCHGNLCRSPAAEHFLRRHLSFRPCKVFSAGLSHQENLPTPQDFAREARSFGIDLAGHRSRTMTHLLLEWADIILIMDRSNQNLLLDFGQAALKKSAWLGTWDPAGPFEIPDPYGKSPAVMRQVLGRLSRATGALAREISTRIPAP